MKKRVIARLDIKKDRLIKGIHLEGLRVIGDPQEYAYKYYKNGIDELLLLDSVATLHGRNALVPAIKKITENIFIPICVGGGIQNIGQAHDLFDAGADKITINTASYENPSLLKELSDTFGSQSIVLSIQAKKYHDKWIVMTHNGREKTNKEVNNWLEEAQEYGIGEVMITSIDSEGTGKGFDNELLKSVKEVSKVNIICSGGISREIDAKKCFENGASAIACARSLHYEELNIYSLKMYLHNNLIPVRIS